MCNEEDKIVWGVCLVNCGSCCVLCLYVKDNEVWWVEIDNIGDDVYGNYQVCVCLWGCLICWCINYLDCFNYFMKCVGCCGEGKFECISWQEVLDIISVSLKKIVEIYGNEVVYIYYLFGIVGGNIICLLFVVLLVKCLMNCYGGLLN